MCFVWTGALARYALAAGRELELPRELFSENTAEQLLLWKSFSGLEF